MRRRLPSLLMLLVGVLLMFQTGVGLVDAARAHVRCSVHGDLLHTDEAGSAGARDDSPALRAEVDASLHHGCDVAEAVLPSPAPLPQAPSIPGSRWRLAPASANAPPERDPHTVAALLRAPKTSPPAT